MPRIPTSGLPWAAVHCPQDLSDDRVGLLLAEAQLLAQCSSADRASDESGFAAAVEGAPPRTRRASARSSCLTRRAFAHS